MEYEDFKTLKEQNITMKLFQLDNFPLIISFLYQEFKKTIRTNIYSNELIKHLTDFIYNLRQTYEDYNLYPQKAATYLEEWSNDGFLRKYYTDNSDEACFELTFSTEEAFDWIKAIENKEVVGTESRLINISDDPKKKIKALSDQLKEIDEQIKKLEK